jgi:hypothetical protein
VDPLSVAGPLGRPSRAHPAGPGMGRACLDVFTRPRASRRAAGTSADSGQRLTANQSKTARTAGARSASTAMQYRTVRPQSSKAFSRGSSGGGHAGTFTADLVSGVLVLGRLPVSGRGPPSFRGLYGKHGSLGHRALCVVNSSEQNYYLALEQHLGLDAGEFSGMCR